MSSIPLLTSCALGCAGRIIRRSCLWRNQARRGQLLRGQRARGFLTASDNAPINKEVTVMTDQLYSYLLEHTREHEVLSELRTKTHRLNGSRMQISPEQGAFMSLLAMMLGVKKAIDIGVFTGYSSLSVALGMPPGSRLVACDVDASTMEVAKTFWEKAGVSDRVEARLSKATDTLQELLDNGEAGTYDFIFIDADKRGYAQYYEMALQLLRPGGIVGVDNVLWYGKVADQAVKDKNTVAIREFNDLAVSDERVDVSLVPIGDGMMLCRKR